MKAVFFDFDGTIWFGKYGEKTFEPEILLEL